jgi:hypothetical protein
MPIALKNMQRKLQFNNQTSFDLIHLCYYFSMSKRWDNDYHRLARRQLG